MAEPEERFRLLLHYDGSDFHGWQAQPGQPTVQGALQRAAERIAGGRRAVLGAGRTDTGVHATGQVAALDMPNGWSGVELARALNAVLPTSIWVEAAGAAPPDFHPRRDAVRRSYRYRVGVRPEAASPFRRRWCWPLCRELDIEAARRASRVLVGVRDFRRFAKAGQEHRGHLCKVASADWVPWGGVGLAFEITANRFLHRMVRYLVGTMVEIALGRRSGEEMEMLLEGAAGLVTSRPAPPGGLFLTGVEFDQLSADRPPTAFEPGSTRPSGDSEHLQHVNKHYIV